MCGSTAGQGGCDYIQTWVIVFDLLINVADLVRELWCSGMWKMAAIVHMCSRTWLINFSLLYQQVGSLFSVT